MKRQSLRTQGAQIVFGEITPQPYGQQANHRTPHDHPYDMLLVVLRGTMMQEVEGIDYKVEAGCAMIVPQYYMHRGYAYGDEPAVLFEVFAPARTDYIDLVDYQTEYRDQGAPWVTGRDAFTWTPFTRNVPGKKRPPLYRLADLPVENTLHEGRMRRRSIRTQNAQVVWADITPARQDYHHAPQDHPYETMVICQKGCMRIEVDGVEYDLPADTAMIIPPFAMHRSYAKGNEPVSLLEIYAPARLDYNHLVRWQQEDFLDPGQPWVISEFDSWSGAGSA